MTIVKAFENRIPEVSQSLLHRLRAVHGFSEASCVKALYHTGGRSLSEAVEWIYNHIEDPDLHQFIEVPVLVVRFLCDACIELTGCSGSFLSFSALERHVSSCHKRGSWAVCSHDCATVVRSRLRRSHVHSGST